MFIYLVVSPENIRKSRRNSSLNSPLGLAIRDAGIDKYTVHPTRLLIYVDGTVYESKLRGAFRKFQDDYLAGKPLSPIDGDLRFFALSDIQKDIRQHINRVINEGTEYEINADEG